MWRKRLAQRAACQAEHALGPEIIGRLLSFIDYVAASGQDGCDLAGEFRLFHGRRSTEPDKRIGVGMSEGYVEQNQVRPLSTVTTGRYGPAGSRAGRARIEQPAGVDGICLRMSRSGWSATAIPVPFVVIIKDVKMVLGRGVAQKILIR